jgi:NADPH:quinone reductase-like Zn-dependent oxidoreductase
MDAIVQERYGDAETLRSARVPVPQAGDREVLLRVHAAGLDRGTWHLMTGRPYLLRLGFGLRGPRQQVIGRDVAGTVVAVGPQVAGLAVGDEVFGTCTGAFAEYATAREDRLARKPRTLSFEQAAVVPVSATTALQALRDAAKVQPGQTVLITGASGGVGSYAVQLAKALGAEVTAVCSTSTIDLVRSLGADHVVDRTCADFAQSGRRYDVVIDIAGNPSLARLRRTLTPTGTAVLVGGEEGDRWTGGMGRQLRALVRSRFSKQRFATFIAKQPVADLDALTRLIESGAVTPSIGGTYPLSQVPDAMRRLDAGTARGKLAISV